MKNSIKLILLVMAALALGGCYIHNGEICSIAMPQIYCDKEAYARLTKPIRASHNWAKDGKNEESRLSDWIECGGTNNGDYGLLAREPGNERTTKEIQSEIKHLAHSLQRCMLKKGYIYTGQCLDTDVSRAQPACGAT